MSSISLRLMPIRFFSCLNCVKNGAHGMSLWIVTFSGGGWCGQKIDTRKCPASCVATTGKSFSCSSTFSSNSVSAFSISLGFVSPVMFSRIRSRATERQMAFTWSPLNAVPVCVMYRLPVRLTAYSIASAVNCSFIFLL